jgi:undecaprenyl-diphosphatase
MRALKQALTVPAISSLDLRLCLRLAGRFHGGGSLAFFRGVSRLGNGVLWYALAAALPLLYGASAWPAVLRMMVAGAVGLTLYRWIKTRTGRERPFVRHPGIFQGAAALDRYSFPSGHTLHAVAFTAISVSYFPVLAWALVPFTVLVGFSRVVLGLHYPSDVLAGATLGATIAGFTLLVL